MLPKFASDEKILNRLITRISVITLTEKLIIYKTSDLYEMSVYLSNASNPTITSLRFGKKQRRSTLTGKWCGIVTTYDCQTISYIATILNGSPSACVTMLLGGFCRKVEAIFVVLDTSESIKKSTTIDMSWCRRMWSIFSKAHLVAITSVYYSVLGGAYCSLGKSNSKYVSWKSVDNSHSP